jgi:hypothetical protein
MDPKAAFSLGYTPNNWVIPDVSSGQFAIDRRVARFWDALSKLLPTLRGVDNVAANSSRIRHG